MAKLADALASGASGREVVQVQVLFRAHKDPCKCKGLLLSHPHGTPNGTLPAPIFRFDRLSRNGNSSFGRLTRTSELGC